MGIPKNQQSEGLTTAIESRLAHQKMHHASSTIERPRNADRRI